jgi:hypothetical protein
MAAFTAALEAYRAVLAASYERLVRNRFDRMVRTLAPR